MAHHLVGLEWDFLGTLSNVLLTRHPKEMLMSYKNTIPEFKISIWLPEAQKTLRHHCGDGTGAHCHRFEDIAAVSETNP